MVDFDESCSVGAETMKTIYIDYTIRLVGPELRLEIPCEARCYMVSGHIRLDAIWSKDPALQPYVQQADKMTIESIIDADHQMSSTSIKLR